MMDMGQDLVHAGRDNIFAFLKPQLKKIHIAPILPLRKVSELLNTISRAISCQGAPVVHFVSVYRQEGAGNIAFDGAVAIAQTGKRVLLIDASPDQKSFRYQLRKQVIPPLEEIPPAEGSQSPILMAEGTNLFFAAMGEPGHDSNARLLRDTGSFDSMIAQLRHIFDLIVIESEGALRNPGLASVARVADANVVVVGAERTRLPVVKELKRILEADGGRVVGSVLARRRHHIPRILYALLFRG